MNATSRNCGAECHLEGPDPEEGAVLPPGMSAAYDTFPVIIAMAVIVMNSLAVLLIIRVRRLRTVTNIILTSLATSDLLMGVAGIPLYLSCSATYDAPLCVASSLFVRFISISTVLHHLLVSIDRHVAVVRAMRYAELITKRKVYIALSAIWGTAVVGSFIQLSWVPLAVDDITVETHDEIARIGAIYNVICLVVFFGVPLVTMIVTYSRIFVILRTQLHAISRENTPCYARKRYSVCKREWRAVIILSTMVAVYVVCYIPYFLLDLQHQLGDEFFELHEWVEYIFFYYPRLLVSLLNPLLYIFGKQDFRHALLKGRLWRRGPSEKRPSRDMHLLTPTHTNTRSRSTEFVSLGARLSRTLQPIDIFTHKD